MILILAVACGPQTVQLSSDDSAVDSADTADSAPLPSVEDWAGDWVGAFAIDAFGDGWWEGCQGGLELAIEEDGQAAGEGLCVYNQRDYEVVFEGEIDADGALEGTLTVPFLYAGDVDCALSGQGDGDELTGAFEGVYTYQNSAWEFTGSIDLTRD